MCMVRPSLRQKLPRFCRGGKRKELLPAEEAIAIRVAPPKPFRRLGCSTTDAELREAKLAIVVGIERGKLGRSRVCISSRHNCASGGRSLGRRRFGVTRQGLRMSVVQPDVTDDDSTQETGDSDSDQQSYVFHGDPLIMQGWEQYVEPPTTQSQQPGLSGLRPVARSGEAKFFSVAFQHLCRQRSVLIPKVNSILPLVLAPGTVEIGRTNLKTAMPNISASPCDSK